MKTVNSFSEGLTEKEQQIILNIKDSPVPIVTHEEIMAVCKVAASYYTGKQSVLNIDFWKITFSCLTIKTAFFWLLAAFLLGSCVAVSFLTTRFEIEPLAFMTALSPVPVLAFAIRELQYRDNNLVQLEKTCKYAPEKIYFARLWIGVIFNALFVVLAGVIAFPHYKNLLRLYLCSFIAMFLVGAVVLLLMSFLDSALPLSLTMAVWVFGAIYLLGQYETLDIIMGTSMTVFIVFLVLSFGLFAVAAIKSKKKIYA